MATSDSKYDICVVKLIGGKKSVMFSIPREALVVDKRTIIADGIALFATNKDSQYYIELDVGDAGNLDRLGVKIKNVSAATTSIDEVLNFIEPPLVTPTSRKYNLED